MAKQSNHYLRAQEKAWRYVGRFMHGFACVEGNINEVFLQLFNLEKFALIFLGNVDLRKKLKLIDLGLKYQGVDADTVLSRVHELHDIRNAIAHSWFESFEDVITFDHVGRVRLPKKAKARSKGEFSPFDSEITYSQFDGYDEEMTKLATELGAIADSAAPITDAAAVEEAIKAAGNVLRFPKRSEDFET